MPRWVSARGTGTLARVRWTARDTVAAIGALVVVAMLRCSGVGGSVPLESLPGGAQESIADSLMEQPFGHGPGDLAAVDFSQLPRDLDDLGMEPTEGAPDPMLMLFAAFERCGTVDLSEFEGRWSAPSDVPEWADAVIARGRLEAGTGLRAEHCAIHVVERTPTHLVAATVWHEDVGDPGDAWFSYLRLDRRGERLAVCVGPDRDALDGAGCVELTRVD